MAREEEWLYVIRAVRPEMVTAGPDAREEAILSQHTAYLQTLAQRGVVLVFGRTQRGGDPSNFGIVIFRASDREEARAVVENDPAVAEGLMKAELYPYRVAGLASTWSPP